MTRYRGPKIISDATMRKILLRKHPKERYITPITFIEQPPLHKRIVARVTLPLYLGLALGIGILIGKHFA